MTDTTNPGAYRASLEAFIARDTPHTRSRRNPALRLAVDAHITWFVAATFQPPNGVIVIDLGTPQEMRAALESELTAPDDVFASE